MPAMYRRRFPPRPEVVSVVRVPSARIRPAGRVLAAARTSAAVWIETPNGKAIGSRFPVIRSVCEILTGYEDIVEWMPHVAGTSCWRRRAIWCWPEVQNAGTEAAALYHGVHP